MKLKLHNNTRLSEIKEAFHAKFPFLKLEFFNPEAGGKQPAKSDLLTDGSKTLGEIAELNKPGYISIHEYDSVASVEQRFRMFFGIPVQVFRKSGASWLETTSSDVQTLAELNAKGEDAEKPFLPEFTPDDIHEQR